MLRAVALPVLLIASPVFSLGYEAKKYDMIWSGN